MKRLIFLYFFSFLTSGILAQSTEKYNGPYANFYRAEELFEKEQFAAARYEFRAFIQQHQNTNDPLYIKALYYEGIAALELYNNDAVKLLVNFNKNYPESIYKYEIFFRLGKYFYQKKEFQEAVEWFSQIPPKNVSNDRKEEYYFKLGYAQFQEKKVKEAKVAFYEIKNDSTQYGAPALYYYSHICYSEKLFQPALEGFELLKSNKQFSKAVPYYIAQIYYLQGKYDAVAAYAPTLQDSTQIVNKKDLNHLIGDAYCRIGKYDEAIVYLEAYHKESKVTRDDLYTLGYAYYRTKNYTKAIKFFDKTTRPDDSLSQIAYYHIGESYLNMNNLSAARQAFEASSKINKNDQIREDALYNYAVLSFKLDVNPYDEAVDAFQTYLLEYPESSRRSDVYHYLVNVYTSTNNYKKALESLDKVAKKDVLLKKAYQMVAYNYGVEFYQKDKFNEAIQAFDGVYKYDMDASVSAMAKFWIADAHYKLKNYKKSNQYFKEFILMPGVEKMPMKYDAYYNIGYANLNEGDTATSIENFRMYTQSKSNNKAKIADAYMRIADGYFAMRENTMAIKNYQEVLNLKAGYEDQALFYMAKSYGFAQNEKQKISALFDIINNYPKSKYMILSIYTVAISLKGTDQFDKSLTYFDIIINDYPNSTYVTSSKLEKADILFKKQEFIKAEIAYKAILGEYNNENSVCESAARGLIEVYKAQNKLELANEAGEKYPCANFSVDEKEDMFYAPAIRFYKDSNYVKAAMEFEKYLSKFPSGRFKQEATLFKANCHFALKEVQVAIPLYKSYLEGPNNVYTEYVAARLAQYFYNEKQYEEAIGNYQRLDEVASKPEFIYAAKLGLMRCHFLIENYESVLPNAEWVLGSQITNSIRLEANYSKGMASYYLNQFAGAKENLQYVFKNTTTSIAAETKYALADIYYQEGDYKNSDDACKAIVKMKPSYNYWIAKALMTQAKIMVKNNDLFQAEQTLKSIIDHYKVKDDGIIEEANTQLNELLQLKSQPKSIPNETETEIEINEN